MAGYLIKNISVVNEGSVSVNDVHISNGRIQKVAPVITPGSKVQEINGEGKYLLPGAIDDQVHFRQPGLTHKADIYTESKAAVRGGVTSFMEMPNTVPPVFTQQLLEEKYAIAGKSSLANYSFYMGTSNDNMEEALLTNEKRGTVCGIKVFMGSSTGGLLVDNYLSLDRLFRESAVLIATHCEDENIIRRNYERLKQQRRPLTAADHPVIRDETACFESSLAAIQFAKKHGSRLHILHISTEKELQLFSNMLPLEDKRITTEVCVHHLHFTSDDYDEKGNLIKCNPAIKEPHNKAALWQALLDGRLDVIATDHAPHTMDEKMHAYEQAHAGIPLVQHSLLLMLQYVREGRITLEKVADKMSHAVATCFQIKERGYIREGYFADLVIIDMDGETKVSKDNILYKCGWSPFDGNRFPAAITNCFVNGEMVYGNNAWNESNRGMRLQFNR